MRYATTTFGLSVALLLLAACRLPASPPMPAGTVSPPTPSSLMPTAACTGSPVAVEPLPMRIAPETLVLSAGESARYAISALAE